MGESTGGEVSGVEYITDDRLEVAVLDKVVQLSHGREFVGVVRYSSPSRDVSRDLSVDLFVDTLTIIIILRIALRGRACNRSGPEPSHLAYPIW